MSDIPPVTGYANYPRSSSVSKAKVQLAADAYFGYGKAFLFTILFGLGTAALHLASNDQTFQLIVIGIRWIGTAVFVGWITYPLNQKLGQSMEWPDDKARNTSILMALLTLTCLGIVAFIYGQHMASTQLIKLGTPKKWYGLSKKNVNAYLDSLPEDVAPVAPQMSI